ncbi:translation initiation factor IF-2 [Ureaplasma urealyticum]|uniref:Translation initiation factor IF-2 n=2 Tax=Ureaplasma urealyticum TaxID=2130 RepID=A0AAP9D7L6_UREUR|nr:translation initiation factor IF-2 [Ureaplasma urealyticum]EDX53904.1 translation initiation factor IF-2 [Ureaplasma urealyticum serovar 9 str. ATCC 33175]EDT49289.1 translation initiation factor IF-2 [Ureaplasma urealyticum serovar 13 str. ATCC 33698]EDU05984.1 translation initiation factor IF-2 [Ureaplasma urealyticum serovar 5 str. ATCC 27817]EDU56833.1 translation initiation factor IF-2 [Ureaplasma urealyticum serovar 7 str. ATCC 27819]EDU66886.1 translation initiation factor IF-2 [Urea
MAKKNIKQKKDNRIAIDVKKHIKKVDVGVFGGTFVFTSPLSIAELAPKLNKSANEIIMRYFKKGVVYNLNTILDEEQIGELCLEYDLDFKIEKNVNTENLLENIAFDDLEADLVARAPIVTIMGHVDHGKTTLLDTIRKSSVTASEAGGITQHIGAYQILKGDKPITFIDTPGHEAFTEMRARGANLTDIVILVVAADDGIKMQTEEAIDHAKAANVPIIVFVNKMDKYEANPDKVLNQLSAKEIVAEELGGDIVFVKGSALKNEGIFELLDSILLIAELNDYKANPNRLAYGTTIEANLDKGHGPLATLLVQNGTLRKGDYLVVGSTYGKIRNMFDEYDNEIEMALPSKPVKVSGFEEVPTAGDKFLALADEKQARAIANDVKQKKIRLERSMLQSSDIRAKIANGELKNINLIIKADVQGSLEALKGIFNSINIEGVTTTLVRSAIGTISESDVRLAQTSDAIIIGFNVRANRIIKDLADSVGVQIMNYDIIYKFKEDLEAWMKGTLDPIIVEEVIGEAKVLKLFKHSQVGTICGCRVINGKIKRNALVRVLRDGIVIYNSKIATLQHNKDSVNEVIADKECGLTIANFNDVKENDIIEVYVKVEKNHDEVK